MEELQKLYDVLVREGKYTKSFEEFQNKWSNDQSYQNKVYDVVNRDGLYTKDKNSFLQKYSGNVTQSEQLKEAPVKKKLSSESGTQKPPQNTTASPSADGSSATQKQKPYNVNKALVTNELVPDYVMGKLGIDKESLVGKTYDYLNAQASNATSSVLTFLDSVVNSAKNSLKEEGFFDEDMPDTEAPITDAVKSKINPKNYNVKDLKLPEDFSTKPLSDLGPKDPTVVLKAIAGISSKIINSSLSQEQKKSAVASLNEVSSDIKKANSTLEEYRKGNISEGVFNNVVGGILGFIPDIAVAAMMKNPKVAEGRLVDMSRKATKNAIPVVAKYAPKAAAFLERGAAANMTKIFAVKGGLEGMAEEENEGVNEEENVYIRGIKGAAKGFLEGIYMHGLGELAGMASPTIARFITKAKINNAVASELAMPLANAGVFATAKALRTPIEEGRLATPEELATEVGMGVGFSLLHIGSQYKGHKELDHYYETVIKDNPLGSFSRVLNETRENLELAYDPNLTEAEVKELEDARAELKEAAIKEVDLKVKKTLGDEALKIQNKLDAHYSIKKIVENKDAVLNDINSNESLSSEQKEYFTRKVSAIAEAFDMSEYAVRKRELNTKIVGLEKELESLSTAFTNLKNPSDRAELKVKIDEKRAELESLNNDLTDFVTNKAKEDAVQKQSTTEVPVQSETKATTEPKGEVVVPESEKAEYDSRLEMHEENSAMAKKYLEEEKAKRFFSRNKSDVKYFEERIKFHEEKAKLLKENPAEYYRELLKEEQKYYEDEIKGNPEFKQSQIDNYGTTDFNVTNSNVIDNYNRKISNYEGVQKTAEETTKPQQDAVQKQSTTEVPVQSETGTSETMEGGTPQTEPEVVAEQATQEEVTPSETIVNEQAVEAAPAETKPTRAKRTPKVEAAPETEVTPAEEKFIIDGKEYTKEEALDKRKNRTSIPYGSKMEYNGNDQNAKDFVDDYNKDSNAYDSNGNLKENYMMQEISKAFQDLNFRKFGNLFRKHIDPYFKRSNNEKNVGGRVDKNFTWEEQASYRIGDRGYSVTEEQFRAFAKEAGISIPEQTTPKTEVKTIETNPITSIDVVDDYNDMTKQYRDKKKAITLLARDNEITTKEADSLTKELFKNLKEATRILQESKDKAKVTTEPKAAPTKVSSEVAAILKRLADAENKRYAAQKAYFDARQNNKTGLKEFRQLNKTKKEVEKINAELQQAKDKANAPEVAPKSEVAPAAQEAPTVTPKAEATKAEAAPTVTSKAEEAPAKSKEIEKIDKEIDYFEKDVDYYESKIQEIEEEIAMENSNTKDGLVELKEKAKKEIEEVKKDKTLDKFEKIDKIEEIKYEIENFKEEQESIIESYKDDLKVNKAELKKASNKLNKLYEKKRNASTEAISEEINDFLDLDAKDKGSLERLSDFLDRVDKSLDINPNELNDVTRVMAINTAKAVVKTLKALVDAGITLREAIKMAAAAHKVKEEQIIDALDIVSKVNENKSEKISEMELPGYNKLSSEIDTQIKGDETIDNVLRHVKGSDSYKYATDVQKELLVRDVRKRFGLKEKSAPSIGKLFGTIKDVTKITMTEKAALVKQIKDLARGGNDAKLAIKEATQSLIEQVKELRQGGKINKIQEQAVLGRLGKTNVLSEKSIKKYIDYVSKVYADAEYSNKLSEASKLKSEISALSKNKDKNANLRDLGKKFSAIDPSMVDNIYEYNEMAAKIKEAIAGSKIRKSDVKFAETVNIDEAIDFTNKALEKQREKERQESIDDIQDILGVDASEFSAEEIRALLESDKELSKDDEKVVRAAIQKAFDIYSTTIKETIKTGKDVFTGEDVQFPKKSVEIIEDFMDMDLSMLKPKEALAAVDALQNFLTNKSTAKMSDVLARYTGELAAKELYESGKKGIRLRKFFSTRAARILAEGGSTMPILFEKIFKGATAGLDFGIKSGFNRIVNGRAVANTEVTNMTKEYIKKFFDKKANGEKFNTAYNDAERGIASDLSRSIIGTEEQIQKEFERRKLILEKSIDELSTGTKEQQYKSELYQKVYDKIVKGSENAEQVLNKIDPLNLKAIEHWKEIHENNFEKLSDYMLNIHNTLLEKELNYSSPDRFLKIKQSSDIDLSSDQPMFGRNGEYLYKKEASGLMKANHPEILPKGRYRDYSFDKNNIESVHDALVDMNTGFSIRQLEAFRKSEYFKKIIKTSEDRALLNRRFELYVSNIRNKSSVGGEDLQPLMKTLDRIGTIGVGMALGSPTQTLKQVIPVAVNTLANTGRLDIGAAFNPSYNTWLNSIGYAIGNRGVESQAQISSLNRKIETASNKVELVKAIENANKWWLRQFLVKPDVFIARASFQTYYESYLRKNGLKEGRIDYKDHKVNKDAADYAQAMVDRQQNVSDHELSGSWFSTNKPERKMLSKIFLNFASFRMNQSARLASDLSTLGHWSASTTQDKAIAASSMAGFAAEMAMFKFMAAGISIGIGSIANNILGNDETEEEKEKRKNGVYKAQLTSSFTDMFSPAPFLDVATKWIAAPTLQAVEDATGVPISIYGAKKEDYVRSLGGYGIAFQRAGELWDLIMLGTTGKYTDDFGKEQEISETDRETIQQLIPFKAAATVGLLPSDISTGVNSAAKAAKKGQKEMSQEEMKSTNPRLYERMYGEGSVNSRLKEREKAVESRLKEREDRIKERMKNR